MLSQSVGMLLTMLLVWRQLFQANWKGFSSDITMLKENLRRHKQLIESRASLIEFENVKHLRLLADASFRDLKEAESKRRKASLFQWLSCPGVEAAHERHIEVRAGNPQSCRWILREDLFQRWFDRLYCSTPLLWINGKPGAGSQTSNIYEL